MKRFSAAIILTAFIIISEFICVKYINRSCEKYIGLIDKCKTAYFDGENIGDDLEEIKSQWEKDENFMSFFVNHKNLSDVDSAIKTAININNRKHNDKYEIALNEQINNVTVKLLEIKEEINFNLKSIA